MESGHRKIRSSEPKLVLGSWALFLLIVLFIVYPLGSVFVQAFQIQTLKSVFADVHFGQTIFNTLLLGVCSACVSTAIGFVFAFAVTRTNIPWKKIWQITAMFPMISPPFLAALSAIILLGNNGLITRHFFSGEPLFPVYGFWGLLLVQAIGFFPISFLICSSSLVSIDPVLEEAAMNSGANRMRTFWSVIFPLSLPALMSSFLLIFIESLADFGNPLVLAGDFKVLSVESYLRIVGSELDLAGGALLSVFLLIPALIAFLIQQAWISKKSFVTLTGKPSSASLQARSPLGKWGWTMVCTALASFVLLIYGVGFLGSFMKIFGVDSTLTLSHYQVVLGNQFQVLLDSIYLSLIATPLSGLFGIVVAYYIVRTNVRLKRAIEWGSLLTFAVPGTVVGIGYALAFNQPPLMLQGSWLIIVLLFVFRNAPVGIRAGVAALLQIDRSIDEASLNLGAGRFTTLRKIILPLLAPAFFSGLSFAFVRSMNSISAVIFVVSGNWSLITISIMNFFENGELSKASALCVVLVLIALAVFGIFKMLLPKQKRAGFVTSAS